MILILYDVPLQISIKLFFLNNILDFTVIVDGQYCSQYTFR